MALLLWPQVQIYFKTRTLYSLFFEEFISLIKNWQVQGQTIFWFIFAKELVEFREKTPLNLEQMAMVQMLMCH